MKGVVEKGGRRDSFITAQQNMNKHKTCLLISDSSLQFLNEYLFWPKDKGIEP